jgi:cytochrome c biogenesis protein
VSTGVSKVDIPEIDVVDQARVPPPGTGRGRAVLGLARRWWRWLTSMRTALVLLFLLAVAAIPGSLLPQRNVSPEQVAGYLRAHPRWGPWLGRLWGFDVFASPWFSAIYLLLFVSLVGCLLPRARTHLVAVLRRPPDAPARLARMPVHTDALAVDAAPADLAACARRVLRRRRFRTVLRTHPGGIVTLSAEKGYLKETGNLVFHLSLLALLVGVAFGSWFGWHANRIVVAGADQAFCNTLQQYDDYGLGARVNPTGMQPFCLQLDDFQADYLDDGQPVAFTAHVTYTVDAGSDRTATVQVNHPLRLSEASVYLLGHGYAPVVRYTDRQGHTQTTVAAFLPTDSQETSDGVALFADANIPPGGRDPNSKQQVAFSGAYLPTAAPGLATSVFPAERNPTLVLVAYRGDLGLDTGIPHSVYTLNQGQINTGRLVKVSEPIRLRPGQSATLDDGSTVQFLGTRAWVSVAVRYNPGQPIVLTGAVLLLTGLVAMLAGRRRRIWLRITPTGDPGRPGSLLTAAALSRGHDPDLATELDTVITAVRAEGNP